MSHFITFVASIREMAVSSICIIIVSVEGTIDIRAGHHNRLHGDVMDFANTSPVTPILN